MTDPLITGGTLLDPTTGGTLRADLLIRDGAFTLMTDHLAVPAPGDMAMGGTR